MGIHINPQDLIYGYIHSVETSTRKVMVEALVIIL